MSEAPKIVDQESNKPEDKDVEVTVPEKKVKFRHLKGFLSSALSGFFYALGNSLVKFITQHNKGVPLSEFQVIFVRSVVQIIIIVGILIWKKVNVRPGSVLEFAYFNLMGIFKVASVAFFYLSLKILPLGDATVIEFTAPVWTFIFGVIILKERFSIYNFFFGLVGFLGVAIIAAPGFFFPTDPFKVAKDFSNSSHQYIKNQTTVADSALTFEDNLKGAGFAVLAAICLSSFFIVQKKHTADFRMFILYPSIYGIVFSPVMMAARKQPLILKELTYGYWIILVGTGFSYLAAMMLMGYALSVEEAGPVALVRNSEVLFAFIFEITIEHKIPMMFSIVGVILILLTTSMIVLNRMFSIEKRIWRMLKLYCCNRKDGKPDKEEYELIK